MGIDPGSISTGYGLIKKQADRLECLSYGSIQPSKSLDYPKRLLYIFEELKKILESYRPTEVAIEEIFTSKNIKSAIKLGQARGVALMAVASMGVSIHEYPALVVKKSIVGYGQATKEQIRFMLQKMFSIQNEINLNASDALAIAVCHANYCNRFAEIGYDSYY